MTAVLRSTLTGVLILSLLAGWCLLSTPSAPEAVSGAAAFLVLAAGLLVGRVLARVHPVIPGLTVLIGAAVAFAYSWPESMSGEPLASPLGYMNANGALLLCGVAGGVVATAGRSTAWQLLASGGALVAAVVCAANGALAAAVAAGVLAVWSLVRHLGRSSAWLVAGAVLIGVPGLLPVAWGGGWLPWNRFVANALSEERFLLWRAGYRLMVENPVSGVGPGRFAEESPVADPDLAWAHSYWLQSGAELGVVGLAGLVLLLAWAVAALGRQSLLLGVLLLPASVDYVLQFGGVLLALSVVVGASLGSVAIGKPWFTPSAP